MSSLRVAALNMALLFFVACASRNAAPRVQAEPTILLTDAHLVDLMSDYFVFTARAHSLDDGAAARRFRHDVAARDPQAYSARVFGYDPQSLQQLAPRFIAARSSLVAHDRELRRVTRTLGDSWPRITSTFRGAFPDAEQRADAYLLISLGAFDGATREIAGRPALLFGVDAIATESLDRAGLDALALHELFHIYHARWLPEPGGELREPLWLTLWREGLATLVAQRLVPDASDRALFGGDDATPAALAREMPRLAERFRETLDAAGEPAFAEWFLVGSRGSRVPQRAGYALGYVVAQSIATNRSLTELARLRGPDLRQQLQIALARIAGNY